jgi:hypothetical protein
MASGRRPPAAAASSSFVTFANIANCTHTRTLTHRTLLPASAPSALLSTLLRPPCKGDRACCLHHMHLMRTPLAHLHAGMADALVCWSAHAAQVMRQTYHDHMSALHQLHLAHISPVHDLPSVQESSAASYKCHFCVRHFGRVFDLPYKMLLTQLHCSPWVCLVWPTLPLPT